MCRFSSLFKHFFPVKIEIFYWKVCLSLGQLHPGLYCCCPPDATTGGGTSDWMSACPKGWPNVKLPDVVPLLATRCLYREYIWAQVNWTYISTILGHQMPLPGGMSNWRSAWPKAWPNVKLTWCSTTLGHQMALPGGTSDWRSAWPKAWPNIKLTWCSTTFGH